MTTTAVKKQEELMPAQDAVLDETAAVHANPDISVEAFRILQSEFAHPDQSYLQKRIANSAFWTKQAIQHGSALEATASTDWVRAASLRRLKSAIRENARTLEIGCGNASSLLGPLSHSCRAFGVDITFEMLAAAKQAQKRIKGLARADACRLPFPDGEFDVVYTSRCLINILDPEMQFLAIRELFRVTKQNGTVVLIENFQEPVAAMNRAIEEWSAGEPVIDEHNLLLGLERTLEIGTEAGWRPVSIQGNTMASFLANIMIRKISWRRGATVINRLLYPLYSLLTRIEDRFGSRFPLFGKDTMVILERA
jgi:SAM-dependent methyltransferase